MKKREALRLAEYWKSEILRLEESLEKRIADIDEQADAGKANYYLMGKFDLAGSVLWDLKSMKSRQPGGIKR